MRYAVAFRHRKTGVLRIVVAELSRFEVLDALKEGARRRLDGFPPVERLYAVNRAARNLSPEFEPVLDEITRIPPLQVITNTAGGPLAVCSSRSIVEGMDPG
jgi:hypothetical protein